MAQAPPQPETSTPAAAPGQQFTPFSNASLHVGGLNPEVSEVHLYDLFQSVGPVASVHLCRDFATRRSLGYAYVNFHRMEDAERALETMNYTNIRGRQCRISWAQRDPTTRKSGVGNVFIKNLAKSIDDKTLRDTFSVFGNIVSCRVMTNQNGESRGYGFVHFDSEDMAQSAIKMCNGKMIAGEQVQVMAFKPRRERLERSTFTNVYVNNIPVGTPKEKVAEVFSAHGAITSCVVANPTPDSKNRGTTYAFVNYADPTHAAAAIAALNGTDAFGPGKKVLVTQAQSRETRERQLKDAFEQRRLERSKKYQGINVYTKNLPETMDDNGLRELFSKFGNISSAKVMVNPQGKSRGFGFVCFTTPEEATKAVSALNQQMVDGKPLYVALAQRKDVRRAALEMQFAQHQKLAGMAHQPMYPPLYYAPQALPAQRMMYPPQMVPPRRGWAQQSRVPQPMVGQQYYMNVAMNGPGPRPSAPRGRGAQRPVKPSAYQMQPQQGAGRARGSMNANNFKLNAGVRNAGMVGAAPMNAGPMQVSAPLTAQELANSPPETQKRIIGERLFPLIAQVQPERAAKITGMLLDMDTSELLHLLDSGEARAEKISEAIDVLDEAARNEVEGQNAASAPKP